MRDTMKVATWQNIKTKAQNLGLGIQNCTDDGYFAVYRQDDPAPRKAIYHADDLNQLDAYLSGARSERDHYLTSKSHLLPTVADDEPIHPDQFGGSDIGGRARG